MKIRASVENRLNHHRAEVSTDGSGRSLHIESKTNGYGSSVNGAELLFLALATCYCNDIYREAEKCGIHIDGVVVEVTGEFGGAGEAAKRIEYSAKISSDAGEDAVRDLLIHTDAVAEIQKSIRNGVSVEFVMS